jgi:hypothetical protein
MMRQIFESNDPKSSGIVHAVRLCKSTRGTNVLGVDIRGAFAQQGLPWLFCVTDVSPPSRFLESGVIFGCSTARTKVDIDENKLRHLIRCRCVTTSPRIFFDAAIVNQSSCRFNV